MTILPAGTSSRAPALLDGWKETDVAELSRLPRPIFELWEWQFGGACRDMEPTMFFHPEGERGAARRRRAEAAKAICADCPVLTECREHALRVREPYGVWGGLSEEERLSLVTAVAEVDGMRQAS